jgi:hypothetical protein
MVYFRDGSREPNGASLYRLDQLPEGNIGIATTRTTVRWIDRLR